MNTLDKMGSLGVLDSLGVLLCMFLHTYLLAEAQVIVGRCVYFHLDQRQRFSPVEHAVYKVNLTSFLLIVCFIHFFGYMYMYKLSWTNIYFK
jgi:hypothetical protein